MWGWTPSAKRPWQRRWLGVAVRFLDHHDGSAMVLLTVAVVAVGWLSVRAARDAAEAAKEQVEIQTLPVIDPGENGLRGFTYIDGRRLPRDHFSNYDLAAIDGTIYRA